MTKPTTTIKTIEQKILSSLFHNEKYARFVLPFVEGEFFADKTERMVFNEVKKFFDKYNACPTTDAIEIVLQSKDNVSEDDYEKVRELIASIEPVQERYEWLIDETEKWCKERAVYIALLQAVKIVDGNDKNLKPDAIPSILQNALAVSFDRNVGHDYESDMSSRYDFATSEEERLPFDLSFFNRITKGGMARKTLTIVLAPTGVGKSLFLCHHAASLLRAGKNVLYITLEMSEEKIAERIDANLLNMDIDKVWTQGKEQFENRLRKVLSRTEGRLIIKEYPTSQANANHFRALLNELKLKKKFAPDAIMVDYINIASSSRIKASAGANSYTIVKAIAEEIRGLSVEFDAAVFSATQTNRGGMNNSDVDLTDVSESMGLPHTADFMFAMIQTEELEELNQIMIKQLKNRYADKNRPNKFVVGIDRAKMKLFDLEDHANDGIIQSVRQNVDAVPENRQKRDFSKLKL